MSACGPHMSASPLSLFLFPSLHLPGLDLPHLSLSLEFAWRPGGPPPPRALRQRSSTPSNRRRPFSPPSPPTRSAAVSPPPPPSLSSPVPHPLRSPLPSLGHRPAAGLAVLNTGVRTAHHPPPSRLWRRPDPRRPCSLPCGPAPSSSSPAMAAASPWPEGAASLPGRRPELHRRDAGTPPPLGPFLGVGPEPSRPEAGAPPPGGRAPAGASPRRPTSALSAGGMAGACPVRHRGAWASPRHPPGPYQGAWPELRRREVGAPPPPGPCEEDEERREPGGKGKREKKEKREKEKRRRKRKKGERGEGRGERG